MARPKGSPKLGGRQKGTPNKATADIRALAMVHAAKAMTELARLAVEAESEAARVAAIKELFDRGFGKSKTIVAGDEDSPIAVVTKIILEAGRGHGGNSTSS